MKLYELTQNYQNLLELVDRDDIPNSMLVEALHQIEGDITDKIENTVKVIKTLEAESKAFKEEEKRLNDRRKARETQIKNLKQYIEMTLASIKKDKLKCDLFTVAMQKNKASIDITNINLLPSKYLIQQDPAVDKNLIMQDLKEDIAIQGIEIKQSKSLRIR